MLDIVILAAGMGTRMKSTMPKVLHHVAGRPMILEVLATARLLEPRQCVIVVGHGADDVMRAVGDGAAFALQAEQLGTGHAVMQARDALQQHGDRTVLVLYGDTPLTTAHTLRAAMEHHRQHRAAVTLLSFLPDDATGYGRIVRGARGRVERIVEHKDATDAERAIRESNSGIMLFDGAWLWNNLERLALSPQGEYYLTDLAALAVEQGRDVQAVVVDEQEVMGINNRVQLAEASRVLHDRRRRHWMLEGVTLEDPTTVWIDAEVTLAPDTIIRPNVTLRGRTRIGTGCAIGPASLLENAVVGDGCEVIQSSVRDTNLSPGMRVGPFVVINGDDGPLEN
jgi:bifunctional UDP-N-acetylglucosamine pyrophosphorylase / glucosamine-1-phosphate N-acetyltransferase